MDVDLEAGAGLDAGIGPGADADAEMVDDFTAIFGLRAGLIADFDDVEGFVARDRAIVFDAVAVLLALIFSVCVVAPFTEWGSVFDSGGVWDLDAGRFAASASVFGDAGFRAEDLVGAPSFVGTRLDALSFDAPVAGFAATVLKSALTGFLSGFKAMFRAPLGSCAPRSGALTAQSPAKREAGPSSPAGHLPVPPANTAMLPLGGKSSRVDEEIYAGQEWYEFLSENSSSYPTRVAAHSALRAQ